MCVRSLLLETTVFCHKGPGNWTQVPLETGQCSLDSRLVCSVPPGFQLQPLPELLSLTDWGVRWNRPSPLQAAFAPGAITAAGTWAHELLSYCGTVRHFKMLQKQVLSWTKDLQMFLPIQDWVISLAVTYKQQQTLIFNQLKVHAFGIIPIKLFSNHVSKYLPCFAFSGFPVMFSFALGCMTHAPLAFVCSAQHGSQVRFLQLLFCSQL